MSATGGCQTKTNTAWKATKGVITNEQELVPKIRKVYVLKCSNIHILLFERNKEKMRRQPPKLSYCNVQCVLFADECSNYNKLLLPITVCANMYCRK
jgi:hypothetical protein